MVGLMTRWFGPFVEMRPDYGYFYLCPVCYEERIKPHLDEAHGHLPELYHLARQMGLDVDLPDDDGGEESVGGELGARIERAARASRVIPAGGGGGR
jgi:hypothetical protein